MAGPERKWLRTDLVSLPWEPTRRYHRVYERRDVEDLAHMMYQDATASRVAPRTVRHALGLAFLRFRVFG